MAEKGKANVKSCCSKENLNKNKKIDSAFQQVQKVKSRAVARIMSRRK